MVRDSGVVGIYNDLEEAKQVLLGINSGNRLVAEVDSNGNLLRDPHIVDGQNQGMGMQAGFNKYWCGWSCINRLMDMCDIFLLLCVSIYWEISSTRLASATVRRRSQWRRRRRTTTTTMR